MSLKAQIILNTKVKILLLLTGILLYSPVWSQEAIYGILPSLNINKALKKDWRINLKMEWRNSLHTTPRVEGHNNAGQGYLQTDYAFLVSKKVGLNNSLSGGFLLRYKDQKLIHRFMQQFTLFKKYATTRWAHRFAMDQTKSLTDPTKYRIRYRTTLEFPLSGTAVDVKEWYLKVNNEWLNTFQTRNQSVEWRFVPLIGYKFSERNKLESGIDFRKNHLNTPKQNNTFWLNINWYLTL